MLTSLTGQVHHFAISVSDLDVTSSWYGEKFGFSETFRYSIPEMGLKAAFLSVGTLRLEVFEMVHSRPQGSDEASFERYLAVRGLKHVAFGVSDLEGARSELEARDVRFVSDIMDVPNSGGERFCFLADPDGVLLELYEGVGRN